MKNEHNYPVQALCKLGRVSRAGYYKWLKRDVSLNESENRFIASAPNEKWLTDAGMTQSMSRVGKCIDNGPMEGFWGIIKRERYYGKQFANNMSLVKMIEEYIYYCNNIRLQRNLGVLTPMEKHEIHLHAA